MRKCLLAVFLLCLAGLIIAQPGSAHIVMGTAHNPDGTPVEDGCLSFIAWVIGDSSEVLTEDDLGCGVDGADFFINTGNLSGTGHGVEIGITLFNHCTGTMVTITHILDLTFDTEALGIITLVGDDPFLSITVTNPDGGETYFQGANIPIRWESTGAIDDVMIEYTSDGGVSWNVITASTVNTGNYSWVAPAIVSDEMLVKVLYADSTEIFDVSDDFFSIIPPANLDLIYPEGSERFIVGTSINIEWASVSLTGSIDILFSDNAGADWETVETALPLNGNHIWEIPEILSDECLIMVQNVASGLSDQNDPFFEIDTLHDDDIDSIPPADIDDLEQIGATYETATIRWTAPGDDGFVGIASQYELRVLGEPITEANWDEAHVWFDPIDPPLPPGTVQEYLMEGLSHGASFWIAIKTADEIPNWSGVSNTINVTTPVRPDTIPPAPLVLNLGDNGCSFVQLTWIATGDDGMIGRADRYDFRISTEVITDANFNMAEPIPGIPAPLHSGTPQSVYVHDLMELTRYYFAAKVFDAAGNVSLLSNVLSFTTPECIDTIPPGPTLDLRCVRVGVDFIDLRWTAAGDDGYAGTAARYELYIDTNDITAHNFRDAPQYPSPPEPLPGGSVQTFRVEGLDPAEKYHFAIMSYDVAGHRS